MSKWRWMTVKVAWVAAFVARWAWAGWLHVLAFALVYVDGCSV